MMSVRRIAFRGARAGRYARRALCRWAAAPALLFMLTACESDSVFEGEPTVAAPVVQFDDAATATNAIHGGRLPIGLTATDAFVGVDSVVVRYSGALAGSFTRRYAGAPQLVRIDTVLNVPFGVQGAVVFEAFALNRFLAVGNGDTATVQVVRQDTIRPTPSITAPVFPSRVELRDTLRVRVQAQDDAFGSGITTVGIVVFDSTTATPATFTFIFQAPQQTVDHEFRIPVTALPGAATARVRSLRISAFTIDQSGNCAAIGVTGTRVACTSTNPAAANVLGVSASTEVTGTRSSQVSATAGSAVGDMAVDPSRGLVYISNTQTNSIESYQWGTAASTLARTSRAFVGAAPKGIAINRNTDTLIVANSGGTSLSYVSLAGGNLSEISRYETPNAVLYQITATFRIDTVIVYIGGVPTAVIDTVTEILTTWQDFSDRPQYVAQDSAGVVFYSTLPTSTAPKAAMRIVQSAHDASILLPTQVVEGNQFGPGPGNTIIPPDECYALDPVTGVQRNVIPCVITNVDSIKVVFESPFAGTTYDIWDHLPGKPDSVIYLRSPTLHQIATTFRNAGSDIFIYAGRWKFDYWLSDGLSTFVTSSGDKSSVNIAEQDDGRVWNWNAKTNPIPAHSRFISHFVNIEDYINNTASQINAATANRDGRLFAVRSSQTVYFFTNPLRLIGSYEGTDVQGGVGLALHPEALGGTAGSGNKNWAAVGGMAAEVILVDTRNFRRIGTIKLLEKVGGPLRVSDRIGSDAADVVGHIFGVTESGRVFEVPVRTSDLNFNL